MHVTLLCVEHLCDRLRVSSSLFRVSAFSTRSRTTFFASTLSRSLVVNKIEAEDFRVDISSIEREENEKTKSSISSIFSLENLYKLFYKFF